MSPERTRRNRDRLAWAVVCTWMIATVAGLITGDEVIVATVTPVALVVLGFYFGARSEERRGNGSPH